MRRLLAAALLVAFWPAATRITALYALIVVTLIACGLIAWEATTLAAARDRIRHADGTLGDR